MEPVGETIPQKILSSALLTSVDEPPEEKPGGKGKGAKDPNAKSAADLEREKESKALTAKLNETKALMATITAPPDPASTIKSPEEVRQLVLNPCVPLEGISTDGCPRFTPRRTRTREEA
jgi:hypothetical protein